MTPRVKICGLTTPEDVDAAVSAGADALGFIVDVSSATPREIDAATAATLVDRVPPFVTTVLVTMGEDPGAIAALTQLTGVDAVQLHGALTTTLEAVQATVDTPVIAGVDPGAAAAATAADAVLLDATDADGAGGTGDTHDWDRAATIATDLDTPVILAGGLTPTNVAEAIATVDPYAVDVATGVEASGGQKDHDAVHAFIAAAGRRPQA
ncbi:MAG: phosphoribosylanthranilate isomerase [Halobacteriaceae archaeon]